MKAQLLRFHYLLRWAGLLLKDSTPTWIYNLYLHSNQEIRLMRIKAFLFSLLTFGFWITGQAQQDCSLGIGATESDTIIQIFQLKEEQITKLEEFKAALEIETRLLDDERKNLFDTHPQSTPENLTELGVKYKVIEEKMKQVFEKYDYKLLAIFNEKQYQRYVTLCQEVSRLPLEVVTE